MGVEIRPALDAERDILLGLMQELYLHDHMVFERERSAAALRSLISDPTLGTIWLIRKDGIPVGYCVLTYWYSLEFRGKAAFLDELYLQEPYRRKGIGGTIIDLLVDTCRKQAINVLRLEVERKNTNAQEFYRKKGFAAHDRYLMTKWLL